jgi:hypothetical protein
MKLAQLLVLYRYSAGGAARRFGLRERQPAMPGMDGASRQVDLSGLPVFLFFTLLGPSCALYSFHRGTKFDVGRVVLRTHGWL